MGLRGSACLRVALPVSLSTTFSLYLLSKKLTRLTLPTHPNWFLQDVDGDSGGATRISFLCTTVTVPELKWV